MQQKQQGVFIGEDKRGRNAPGNKTPEACIEYICKRIEFFPTILVLIIHASLLQGNI